MCRKIIMGLALLMLATSVVMASTGSKTIIAEGAALHGANGVMFSSGDSLYVCSFNNNEILVMDKETGEIYYSLGPQVGVYAPDDLTFGPDGSLYWTAITLGWVCRLTPSGQFTYQAVAPGVNPITFSNDGRLFVALDFFGDALYELDPDLVDPPELLAQNLGWLNGMDWGPDGYLYGPIWSQGRIVRINVNAAPPVIPETVAQGFGAPAAVKFNSLGELYVVDNGTGNVIQIDNLQTGAWHVLAELSLGLDNLAFDSQNRLFVSSNNDGFIVEVLPNGTSRTVSQGGMIFPSGIAVMLGEEGESVFVGDIFTLREFDGMTGEQLSIVEHSFTNPLGLTLVQNVSADGENLVLTSWFANVVQVWDPAAGVTLEFYYQIFSVPLDAIRFGEDLVVTSLGTGSVKKRVAATGEIITLADGFYVPAGLAATDDDLWATDWATGIAWLIVQDGVTLDNPIPVATGLVHPEGIAVDHNGDLLVIETGPGRLSHIDLETGEISTIVEGLALGALGPPFYAPTLQFNGVAVGAEGVILVNGDITNVLYRIVVTNTACPASYWKNQVKFNLSGQGNPDYTTAELEAFSQNIFDYFYLNEVNPIEVEAVTFVEDPDPEALSMLDLQYMLTINQGGSTWYQKACQQFLAMLLNVVSDKLGLYFQASEDGATTAQAIVYINELLASTSVADHKLARNIAQTLNDRETVAEGVIPLTTPNVIFGNGAKTALKALPSEFAFALASPNPFNPTTTLGFTLPEAGKVSLRIYDTGGRLVTELVNGWRDAGAHQITFDGSGLSSGIYMAKLTAGDFTQTQKLVLLK